MEARSRLEARSWLAPGLWHLLRSVLRLSQLRLAAAPGNPDGQLVLVEALSPLPALLLRNDDASGIAARGLQFR